MVSAAIAYVKRPTGLVLVGLAMGIVGLMSWMELQAPSMLLALTSGTYFLHSASSNFLDTLSPTSSTAKFKDSPSVTRTGFKEIGTWYAEPADQRCRVDGVG